MTVPIYDTFTGTAASDLLAHVGEAGATWARHASYPAVGGNLWRISSAGRAYPDVGGYVTQLLLASGTPAAASHDVLATFRVMSFLSDASVGLVFSYDDATDSGYRLFYEQFTGFRRWTLQKVTAGTTEGIGSYSNSPTVGADVEVRVQVRTTGLVVLFDGTPQITVADTTYTATPGRVGLYAFPGDSTTDTTGFHLDRLAAGAAGFTWTDAAIPAAVTYAYDSFRGPMGEDVLDWYGPLGADYARHPAFPAAGPNAWLLDGQGRAYAYVGGYATQLILLSAAPSGDEYDLVTNWRALSFLSDSAQGIAFGYDPTDDTGYRLFYEHYTAWRRWTLEKVTAGVATTLGQYATSPTIDSDFELRVEARTGGISVKIDGVERIASADAAYLPAGRAGLYAGGNDAAGLTTGFHIDRLAISDPAAALPDYDLSGPSTATPTVAVTYTVALAAGVDPGSVVVTPSATGIAGTFSPTSVTLADADRTKTFTFTPTDVAGDAGTIAVASSPALVDPPTLSLTSGLAPPTRLDAWRSRVHFTHSTGSLPFVEGTGWAAEFGEHYDPIGCIYFARDYCVREDLPPIDWSVELAAEVVRYRDRGLIPAAGGLAWHHRYTYGLTRHYRETGDATSLEAIELAIPTAGAGLLYGGDVAHYLTDAASMEGSRPTAWQLLAMLDAEWVGLGEHPLVDAAADSLIGYCDQWTAAPGTYFAVWIKPWFAALGLRALIEYWARYSGDADATRAARAAAIPAKIRAVCDYIWEECWWPYGVPAGAEDGWYYGALAYQVPDGSIPAPLLALEVQAVTDSRHFTGPSSLSTVDDYYTHANFLFTDPARVEEASRIIAYDGATRGITLAPTWGPSSIAPGDSFEIRTSAEASGPGPNPPLNPMTAPAFAFVYWHTKHVEGDATAALTYRARHDEMFDGQTMAHGELFTQKQWNQALLWITQGLDWRERGDAEWSSASTFVMEAPATGAAGAHSVASGPFRLSVAHGVKLGGPTVVTPACSTGRGTFSPATAVLSDVRPEAVFTFTPDPLDDDASVDVTATATGLTAPSPVAYAVGAADPVPVSSYTLSGPSSGTVGVASTAFTITLGSGTVTGTITFAPASSAGTGTFTPTTVGLTDSVRSGTFTYTPSSAGSRSISAPDDGGLTDPAAVTFAAGAAPDPLAAGTASLVSSGPAGIAVTAAAATGGTSPYSYRWQRRAGSGSYADLADGSGVSGSATLVLVDGSATAGVLYDYRMKATDAVSATATGTAVSAQLYTGGAIGTGGAVAVTVSGYATGQSPADLVLVTPSQKLATDASGRVTGAADLLNATPTTLTGVPTTFPQKLMWVFHRLNRSRRNKTTGVLEVYGSSSAVATTQATTDTTTLQTVGEVTAP